MKCQKCGYEEDVGSNFCPECGSELKVYQKSFRCPYCNEEISCNAVKCKHCGEWLNKKVEMENNGSKDGSAQIHWLIALPLAVITGIILGIFIKGPFDIIYILITLILILAVGYYVKGAKNGALNGLITGTVLYLFSGMISYSYLYFIFNPPIYFFTILIGVILGSIIGVIFGAFGGFFAKRD